ncbi:uncharacterized protein LOC108026749 [Drosophila biarmipes]|uniref:uncharacterized protein LOC108026749 n=1 Tax=Drosophila biarmipes TaxID=125945 RepID=UPI0007E609C7|nr:uncharacterized protein LOC108026749 [Drosophila biarmipes]
MVVCTATMPPETRQLPAMKKEPPKLMDNAAKPEPGDPVDGGEVDEFELIISSEDEEFKLRARIQQLEENNKDVERMDMLSANLHQYNYPNPEPRLPSYRQKSPYLILSDVSSQSEDEFEAQRKYRKHKLRRMGKKHHISMFSDYRRNPFARRQKQPSPPPPVTTQRRRQIHHHHQQPNHHQHRHQQHYTIDDSLDSVTEGELGEYDMNEDNEDDELDLQRLKLTRDKLRLALALEDGRDFVSQYKNSLRERLQYRMHKSPSPPLRKKYPQEEELPLPSLQPLSDEGEEEPEPEQQQGEDPAELKLRLIALKSAILKKHLARKKRDAERAYSPTDMINRVHPSVLNDDIDDLMEISPAASPERKPSAPRFSTDYAVDTKPVDMELAETDSDDQHKEVWFPWSNNWNSMEDAGGSWRCFYPNNLPPVSMPIVIDDENEEDLRMADRIGGENRNYLDDDDDEIPPPPPPFHIPQMHLEDEDARDALHLVDHHSNHSSITEMQTVSMENSQSHMKSLDQSQPDSSEDEAGALRAILLSNLRSCKPPPPPPTVPVPAAPVVAPALDLVPDPYPSPVSTSVPAREPRPVALLKEESNQENDSDDPEELRLLLLSSIAGKKRDRGSKSKSAVSPEILKNAVRRFQSTELSIKYEDQSQDQQPIQEDRTKLEESTTQEEQKLEIRTKFEETTKFDAEKEIINETAVESIQLEGEATRKESVEPPQPGTKLAVQAKKPTSPCTKIIKIIKPNKVINKKATTKRKLPINEISGSGLSVKRPTTLMIKEPSAPLHSRTVITSSTRLITTVDPASIKVNKLIISLAEESAASDDELEMSSSFAYANTDIASPLSLAMGSFSGSTTRSNTPISEIVESASNANNNLRRTVINEYFEKKIDDFLKQARSKAPVTNSPEAAPENVLEKPKVEEKQATIITTPKAQPAKTTPVAVRHLPVASQKEYLRLIERMQMLEQKKVRTANPVAPAAKSKAPTVEKPSPKNISTPITAKVMHNPASAASSAITIKATSGVEKAQVKNAVSKSPKTKAKLSQPSKESRLKAFENSFIKIGGSMLVNLDKSLEMVEEAKKSKAIRLRGSQRLKELYAEMQTVKQAVKQEELKLARIQPEIQASHEIIISLNQKRHKLYTAAMDLGRGLRGADYRLLDEGKVAITSKTTQLTKEIRLYNSIVKFEDLKKLTDAKESQKNTVIEMESTTNPPEAPRETKEPNPQEPAVSEATQPATGAAIGEPTEAETAPAIGSQPEKETETPDDQAVDRPNEVPIITSSPYTVTTMRELREETGNELRGKSYLSAYQTPMSRNYNSTLDVHATICPFDLMGRCEDADCSYLHLARPDF